MPGQTSKPCSPLRLPDFAGRPFTISSQPESWHCLNPDCAAPDLLLLGPGTELLNEPPFVSQCLSSGHKIYWLDCPDLREKYAGCKEKGLPDANWTSIQVEQLEDLAGKTRIYFHKAGLRLAPAFWLPLLGRLEARTLHLLPQRRRKKRPLRVWLPGNPTQLLWKESASAFQELGIEVDSSEPDPAAWPKLSGLWGKGRPDFALSINFRGLDSDGHIASFCQALEIPLAIWLVDNPWNLLSSIRLPWWKDVPLFLTDASFTEELKKYGAKFVHFCPLAASSHMWRPIAAKRAKAPLFVGRSSFPAKEKFFSGLRIPPELGQEAEKMLGQSGPRPDFHWWQKKLSCQLWPGKAGRLPAFCADAFSSANRANWLKKVGENLAIIGDEGWKKLLPGRIVSPPVDYYGSLPELYRSSCATLNVTGWLMPESLNQRHFDVWAAGGVLFSDETGGLKLFPEELSRQICLKEPLEFAGRLDWWQNHQRQLRDLQEAWRGHLLERHLYRHRLQEIMTRIGLTTPEN